MSNKIKNTNFLALIGLFVGVLSLMSSTVHAASKSDVKLLSAGFYQFNNLEIFKSPSADEPPAAIEVIQKNDKSCVVYENGKTDLAFPCSFNGADNNNYAIQIDERTTLSGVNQEPALLTDFVAGDKINVLGWLSTDSKTIRAAVIRNLVVKDVHQSLSGTIKEVTGDGFVLILANGNEVFVKTPIVKGAQITVKGVFDKVNNTVNNVLSALIKPTVTLQENPAETAPIQPIPTSSAKPSNLFKNFLKVFGL